MPGYFIINSTYLTFEKAVRHSNATYVDTAISSVCNAWVNMYLVLKFQTWTSQFYFSDKCQLWYNTYWVWQQYFRWNIMRSKCERVMLNITATDEHSRQPLGVRVMYAGEHVAAVDAQSRLQSWAFSWKRTDQWSMFIIHIAFHTHFLHSWTQDLSERIFLESGLINFLHEQSPLPSSKVRSEPEQVKLAGNSQSLPTVLYWRQGI